MGADRHRPGYQAGRRRIERRVLADYKKRFPDDYQQAWTAAETQERETKP